MDSNCDLTRGVAGTTSHLKAKCGEDISVTDE